VGNFRRRCAGDAVCRKLNGKAALRRCGTEEIGGGGRERKRRKRFKLFFFLSFSSSFLFSSVVKAMDAGINSLKAQFYENVNRIPDKLFNSLSGWSFFVVHFSLADISLAYITLA